MGDPVNVLDKYYLSITLLVTVAYQMLGFAIAWTFQFDKITDFTGGSNFFLLALLTMTMNNTYHARNVVASVLVMVWATRLAGFLLLRVLKRGSDNRFDEIRAHFFKFFGFWIGQIVWVWTVSLPVTILNSPALSNASNGNPDPSFGTGADIVGVILWGAGWLIESFADWQKYSYKEKNPPKDRPCTVGLWKWYRHPPYSGEILVWWGIWTLCVSPAANGGIADNAKSAQYGSIVSPLLTMILLLFASGIPTAEKPTAKKFYLMSRPPSSSDASDSRPSSPPRSTYPDAWSKYQSYMDSTSMLVPIPPAVYRRLPRWLKRSVLLDWGIYRFDPEKDL